PGRMAAVAADDADHAGAALLGEIDGLDEVGADVALGVAAPDREHENRVVRADPADLEPSREDRVPALVVGPRGQFGDVIDRAIGFDAAQLAEIVDRMAAISGA